MYSISILRNRSYFTASFSFYHLDGGGGESKFLYPCRKDTIFKNAFEISSSWLFPSLSLMYHGTKRLLASSEFTADFLTIFNKS